MEHRSEYQSLTPISIAIALPNISKFEYIFHFIVLQKNNGNDAKLRRHLLVYIHSIKYQWC